MGKIFIWVDKDSEALRDNPAPWRTKPWGAELEVGLQKRWRRDQSVSSDVCPTPQKLWFSPQGPWPFLSNIRHCPVSHQRLAFERLHVSESIHLSPPFKWEDTKVAFFPEHPLEQCLNWLLWQSMMWLAFIQLSPNSGHVFPTASTVKPRSNPTHSYQACNWFDFFHTCLSKKKKILKNEQKKGNCIYPCM